MVLQSLAVLLILLEEHSLPSRAVDFILPSATLLSLVALLFSSDIKEFFARTEAETEPPPPPDFTD
jgi:hypothetical protein